MIRLVLRVPARFAKAVQAGLFGPANPELHRERRTDKRGRTEARWVKNKNKEREGWNMNHLTTEQRRAQGVTYLVSTSSSLNGKGINIGVMVNALTSGRHQGVLEGRPWGMDNGAYSGKFDPELFMRALEKWQDQAGTCRFVVAPDVLGDGRATEALYEQWRLPIRAMGFPVAFVAHRGTRELPNCDALFIPATNLDDPLLPGLIMQARSRGLWIHVGKVNSAERMRLAARLGANSADGTHVRFTGLEEGLKEIDGWTQETITERAKPGLLTSLPPNHTLNSVAWDRAHIRDHERMYGPDTPPTPRQLVGLPARRTP